MKKLVLLIGLIGISPVFAQQSENITTENSWFKAGINVGLPLGDVADFTSVTVGADVRGQHLVTPSFGIGIASGYNHFFGKNGAADFGLIPLAGFVRYYAQPQGFFVGTDLGYGFLTKSGDSKGGLYVSPQIGYHNAKWNFYGYYQHTFAENNFDIQVIGLGTTYNIMF